MITANLKSIIVPKKILYISNLIYLNYVNNQVGI